MREKRSCVSYGQRKRKKTTLLIQATVHGFSENNFRGLVTPCTTTMSHAFSPLIAPSTTHDPMISACSQAPHSGYASRPLQNQLNGVMSLIQWATCLPLSFPASRESESSSKRQNPERRMSRTSVMRHGSLASDSGPTTLRVPDRASRSSKPCKFLFCFFDGFTPIWLYEMSNTVHERVD